MVLDPHSITDIYRDIVRVGEAVEREEEALALVRSMQDRIAGLKDRNAGRPRPARIYIEWWPKPAITPAVPPQREELLTPLDTMSLVVTPPVRPT